MRKTISLNYDWQYIDNFKKSYIGKSIIEDSELVNIPHTMKEVPLNYFDELDYQMIGFYSKEIEITEEMLENHVFLEFKGIMVTAEVYLNNKLLTKHLGGYTPFALDITDIAKAGKNLLQVVVDSHEIPNIPPFGKYIDYLCFSGIYREVNLLVKPLVYFDNLKITTDEGFAVRETEMVLSIDVDLINRISEEYNVRANLYKDGELLLKHDFLDKIRTKLTHSLSVVNVKRWKLDDPNLYTLEIVAYIGNKVIDSITQRFGFRTMQFTPEGFLLNNEHVKLIGLNRHQSYPYVGYAMPKRIQELDADILKEYGCNIARTSHYMQSDHFINRCDELGLLVLEEIPGWQYIGDEQFKELTYQNIKDMINNHYNHPSIVTWGVRINESFDDNDFYRKTNELARTLDPTRQTCGIRNTKNGDFLEDIYTYNDFSHTGDNPGLDKVKSVVKGYVPYLVTEHNGHVFPTKKQDFEAKKISHALRHTRVIDSAYSSNRYSGAIGWCLADYNTHYNFGSNDRVCYHGVMDMFRIPKPAAYTYKSINCKEPFIHVPNLMVSGDHPEFALPETVVFTNCDYVKVYKNDEYIADYYGDWENYPNMPNPPIIFDDYIGDILVNRESFSKKDAKQLTKVLYAFYKDGMKAPLRDKLRYLNLRRKKVITYESMVDLVTEFVMLQTDQPTVFRLDGYIDDKLVVSTKRGNTNAVNLSVKADHLELIHGYTYDSTRVVVRMVDEFGYDLPYVNQVIEVKTKNIELIGPNKLNLVAGSTAFYVKTTKSGNAEIEVKSSDGEVVKLNIEIKKGKLEY